MYIVVNSIKRNIGFNGIEFKDILIGFPIILVCLTLFSLNKHQLFALVLLMIGLFMLLPISVSKKNRMYKIIGLLISYVFRKKVFLYTKNTFMKGKVINS